MTLNRRLLLVLSWLAASIFTATGVGSWADDATPAAPPAKARVYVGTYNARGSQGIYQFDFDLATGQVGRSKLAVEAANPSFLAAHPTRRFLYAVGEVANFEGQKTGAVGAFAIDPKSGKLTLINQQPSAGRGPCYVSVDPEGKHVLVANYTGGSVAVLPLNNDGSLRTASCVLEHEGSSVNPHRQTHAYAHAIDVDPRSHFVVAADLGIDKLLIYRLDSENGMLRPNDPPHAELEPGSGPRHFAFHPDGKHAYLINELLSTITAFQWDSEAGALTEIQTVSTLPDDMNLPNNTAAEIQIHPSGKFLYASNRGHDSIAMFAVDADSGQLTALGQESSGGKTPRHFAVDSSGQWLLAANQNSDAIHVFRIDAATGKLQPTGGVVEMPSPVCLLLLPLEN